MSCFLERIEQPFSYPKVTQQSRQRLSSVSFLYAEVGMMMTPEVTGSPQLGECPSSLIPPK